MSDVDLSSESAVRAAYDRISASRWPRVFKHFSRRHLDHQVDSYRLYHRYSSPLRHLFFLLNLPLTFLFLLRALVEFVELGLSDLLLLAFDWLEAHFGSRPAAHGHGRDHEHAHDG